MTHMFAGQSDSGTDMHIRRPPARVHAALPELSHRRVERVRYGPQVELAALEDRAVHALSNERSVKVVHRPDHHAQLRLQAVVPRTYHMVAMTLLKPTKSIVAARLIASSGWYSSVLAVSHALR
jgi:hypothetical protein